MASYLIASLLLPGVMAGRVAVETRAIAGDLFDDIETNDGALTTKVQVKSTVDARPLDREDLATTSMRFRIDDVVASIQGTPDPHALFRLLATHPGPSDGLAPFIELAEYARPLIDAPGVRCYRLKPSAIWPEGEDPVSGWRSLRNVARDSFIEACKRFTIETGCPTVSTDLRSPGPLETLLIDVLCDRVGVGHYPNQHRDPVDAAAQLVHSARSAGANSSHSGFSPDDAIRALGIRVDYGRVEEHFPVVEKRIVSRESTLNEALQALGTRGSGAITGPPGIGKSWLMHQLFERLKREGWLVCQHFCFIDVADTERVRRATSETTFGSTIAAMLDVDPALASDDRPRYAAGPTELESILEKAFRKDPDRNIAILIDGLDHVDRVGQVRGATADLTDQLLNLTLPPNCLLVLASQPGPHLDPLDASGAVYAIDGWSEAEVRDLIEKSALQESNASVEALATPIGTVIDTIVERASGNPLVASYLIRTALLVASSQGDDDVLEILANAPFDRGLDAYYAWLLGSLGETPWLAEALCLIDFPLSEAELAEIWPGMRHYISGSLSRLAPVITIDPTLGGVRIYHESFQRYVRSQLTATDASVADVIAPIIGWLDERGFFVDERSFRAILPLLAYAGRDQEILDRVTARFVINSAVNGQASDAVQANLAVFARTAASAGNFALLTRAIELARSWDMLYQWRLSDDIAEAYGEAFAAVHGIDVLAQRLLHDGRCTFPPRAGLLLCQLCDRQGVLPPWHEYRAEFQLDSLTSNTHYGHDSDQRVAEARLVGRFRLDGAVQSLRNAGDYLQHIDRLPVHPSTVAHSIYVVHGSSALDDLISALPDGEGKAWSLWIRAQEEEDSSRARDFALAAIATGLPRDGYRRLVALDVDVPLGDPPAELINAQLLSSPNSDNGDNVFRFITEVLARAHASDDIALTQARAHLDGDLWYHRWLRFCIDIAPPSTPEDEIVEHIVALSQDIRVFEGSPRVCDLYYIHEEIQASFRRALNAIDDPDVWERGIRALAVIADEVALKMWGARSGPLPVHTFVEICADAATCAEKRRRLAVLAREVLDPSVRGLEIYDYHAEDQLLATVVCARAGDATNARLAWDSAAAFLAAYGQRKDITIYELLDPLDALAEVDPNRAMECARAVQQPVERVLAHTDGRSTSQSIHQWISETASFDPDGGLDLLARENVDDTPSFGDLDDAVSQALSVIDSPPDVRAAGWLAATPEIRNEVDVAMADCAAAVEHDGRLLPALLCVAAAIEGDGTAPPDTFEQSVLPALEARGIDVAPLPDEPTTTTTSGESESLPLGPAVTFERRIEPLILPEDVSLFRMTQAVSRWRDEHGQDDAPEWLTNMVGWRVLQSSQSEGFAAARQALERIARNSPMWRDNRSFFNNLGHGFERHDAVDLAAVAYVFAFTRGRDGWRRFPKREHQSPLLKALTLSRQEALAALATELAMIAANGGENGATVHLIEALASAGHADCAFDAWWAAHEIISLRLPQTSTLDVIDVPYVPGGRLSEPVAAFVAARTNHVLVHQRRHAIAALAILAQRYPIKGAVAIAQLASDAPSAQIAILGTLLRYEPEPYETTTAAQDALVDLATSDFVTVRTIARLLLARIGVQPPLAPPALAPEPIHAEAVMRSAAHKIGRSRLERLETVWPDFIAYAATEVQQAQNHPDVQSRMSGLMNRLRLDIHHGRMPLVMSAHLEQVERAIQRIGSSVRVVAAQHGVVDPDIERALGEVLLPDLELTTRFTLSRRCRPDLPVLPTAVPETGKVFEQPLRTMRGPLTDWVLIAHRETELVIGEGHGSPVEDRIEAYAGIVFTDEDPLAGGGLPLGYGSFEWWRTSSDLAPGPFRGPLAGLDPVRDMFSTIEVLSPHPILLAANGLVPEADALDLTIRDRDGAPAIVGVQWRTRSIGDDDLADQEPTLEGMALYSRPDIFEAVVSLAPVPARYTIQSTSVPY